MPKQGRGTSSGWGVDNAENTGTQPLPDLTGVDLHFLRVMDDPVLLAAVDDVLRCPERFTETWWGEDTGTGGRGPARHSVPAPSRTGCGGA